jgi:hypothetical protein
VGSEGFRVVGQRVGEGLGLLGCEAQVGQQAPARALMPPNVFFHRENVASVTPC